MPAPFELLNPSVVSALGTAWGPSHGAGGWKLSCPEGSSLWSSCERQQGWFPSSCLFSCQGALFRHMDQSFWGADCRLG